MKNCPFCAEEIQNEDIKCKHCGSILDGLNKETNSKPSFSRNCKFTLYVWFEALTIMIGLIVVYEGSFSGDNDYTIIGILIIILGVLIFGPKRHLH